MLSHENTFGCRRILLALGAILLSVLIPCAVLWVSACVFVRNKPFGEATTHLTHFPFGSVNNGELWYPCLVNIGEAEIDEQPTTVRCLNLETGNERLPNSRIDYLGWGRFYWIGNILYQDEVTQIVSPQFGRIQVPSSFTESQFSCNPFEFEGRLSIVVETQRGEFKLYHLDGATWAEGREILLPGSSQAWFNDPQRGDWVLPPRTCAPPTAGSLEFTELNVAAAGNTYHLVLSWGILQQKAYRCGFEFLPPPPEIPSAEAVENAPPEVSEWMPIISSSDGEPINYVPSHCAENDAIVLLYFNDSGWEIQRRYSDGTVEFIDATELTKSERTIELCLFADPASKQSYVVSSDRWGLAAIHRISTTQVLPAHFVKTDRANEYLMRCSCLAGGIVLAYLLHFAILVASSALFTHRLHAIYVFGNQPAMHASVWRRVAARIIDLILFIGPFCVFFNWSFSDLIDDGQPLSRIELADTFNDIESAFASIPIMDLVDWDFAQALIEASWEIEFEYPEIALVSMFAFGLVCAAYLYLQSRFGSTPGKWICGIRTCVATLRPAGIARIIVREFLWIVDVPFLLTPMPAFVSLFFSETRQRFGDRVADTIVIHQRQNGLVSRPQQAATTHPD